MKRLIGGVEVLLRACCIGKAPTDYVFTYKDGSPVVNFRAKWLKVTRAAEVPKLLFHDLRRTGVRNMVLAGIPEKTAMTISGHTTRAIFDRYDIQGREQLEDARLKMEAQARAQSENGHKLGTIDQFGKHDVQSNQQVKYDS